MENGMSAIEKLFDENNNDNIVLYNEKGEATEFEQAALIPYDGKIYALLSLAQPSEEVGEDEGLVFLIDTDEDGKKSLKLVDDEEIITEVFSIYELLLDELEGEIDEDGAEDEIDTDGEEEA